MLSWSPHNPMWYILFLPFRDANWERATQVLLWISCGASVYMGCCAMETGMPESLKQSWTWTHLFSVSNCGSTFLRNNWTLFCEILSISHGNVLMKILLVIEAKQNHLNKILWIVQTWITQVLSWGVFGGLCIVRLELHLSVGRVGVLEEKKQPFSPTSLAL